jgi:frataxin-like iron-binding protein CyaY
VNSPPAESKPQPHTTTTASGPVLVSPTEQRPQVEPTATAQSLQQGPEGRGIQATPQVRVEVIHFHGTHQCNSCKMVGALAKKTVETYFKDELESRRITFADVNGQLAKNQEVVRKYGAMSASLWIGTYVDGEFHCEQDLNVWRKIENEGEYLDYLREVLDKRLSGDLS